MKIVQFYTLKICAFVIILAVLSGCSSSEQSDVGETPTTEAINDIFVTHHQFAAASMALGQVSTQQLSTTIETRGYIHVPPDSRAEVSPFYAGYVKVIDILPGQQVQKGQLLFVLENPEYIEIQQTYLEVKEQIDYLKSDYERQQALAVDKISSEKKAKKSSSDYKAMLARYNGLSAQLKLMGISISRLEDGHISSVLNIYAPISGSITKVDVSLGSFIDASEMAVEIVDAEHMHLELEVFERDITSVEEGQKILFSVPESGDERFQGSVYLVSKSVDSEHRTVNVHGHMTDGDEHRFIPGMFVNAKIVVSSAEAICLPESAVSDLDGQMMVALKRSEDDTGMGFELVQVEIGRKSDGWVEILKPPLEKAQIIVKGAFDVIQ